MRSFLRQWQQKRPKKSFLLEIVDTLFDFAVAENLVLFIRANDQLYMLYNHIFYFVV